MALEFRVAEKQDCTRIAELIHMASDGVVEFLFHDLVPDMTAVEVVAYNLESNPGPHSYKSAIVAVERGSLNGMALSYPSLHHKITDEMRSFFPADRLDHLSEFYSVELPNSWFLDALAVDSGHRRKGLATRLIELTKEEAIKNDYKTLSLITFADNAQALALYEKLEFKVIAEVNLAGNAYIHHSSGCLLLTCEFDA